MTQAKKVFFQHTLKKSLEASFSDCKRPAAKVFIIQFYTLLLFKFLIYLQRFSCNRAFSVHADFEKFENAQKTAFLAVFQKKRLMKFHTEQFVVKFMITYSILHI